MGGSICYTTSQTSKGIIYNLIFVATLEILREYPYQNQEWESYLANFPIQSVLGKHTLYARPRTPVDE